MQRVTFRTVTLLLLLPAAAALLAIRTRSHATLAPVPAPIRVGMAATPPEATAVFAGGCFWGVEAVFEHLKGVKSAVSGYAGGGLASPSYQEVSTGSTGHAESVRVVYDPSQISYEQLLHVFFSVAHDPTELNRQGPDVGTQYRSAIFYVNEEQHKAAEAYVAQLGATKTFSRPIVTEISALRAFYPAENYHQHYLTRHPHSPYIMINDAPKLEHLRQEFPALYREPPTD
ncbi:MAG TPA: peptide-methionine (S)-S-oxide reductase MsrA [Gemmatimonadales bacterium]